MRVVGRTEAKERFELGIPSLRNIGDPKVAVQETSLE